MQELTVTSLCPVRDRIMVLPDEVASESKGGILLPDVSKEAPSRGRIEAIGELIDSDYLHAGLGVVFTKFGGSVYKLADKTEVIFLKPEHILCTFVRVDEEAPGAE